MSEARLDEEGRLPIPPEVRERLGWRPGQELSVTAEGGRLVAAAPGQEASPAAWKERARQLADQMRSLPAARRLEEFVSGTLQPRPGEPGYAAPRTLGEPFEGARPQVPDSCYVHPTVTLVGDVILGEQCSLWPGVVVRGDVNKIRVGPRTNVQDGAVLHVSGGEGGELEIGADVTIGHQACVHACKVADHVLIGIHAVVLDGAEIGEYCLIGAGAVVTPGTRIPPGQLVLGVPARPVRELTEEERERVRWNASAYLDLTARYQPPPAEEPAPALAEEPAPEPPARDLPLPRYECVRAASPVRIDGSFEELAWQRAVPLAEFRLAADGEPPQLDTEVRACWDDEHLYLAFACRDTDVWATYRERDEPLYEEEVVEAFLCPSGDLRHYFEIEVNPLGALFDASVFNPEGDRRSMLVDTEWHAEGLRAAVQVAGTVNQREQEDTGWFVEVAIPFRALGLEGPPPVGTVWRANFCRIERGKVEEYSAWSPTLRRPPDFHVPARFGELAFVEEEEGV